MRNVGCRVNTLYFASVLVADGKGCFERLDWVAFGAEFVPDIEFVHAGVGDGGGQDDPNCNGQNIATRLGKILRINPVGQVTYTVPATNSFSAGQDPVVWAWGLRNPWRNSFDRATGTPIRWRM